MLGAAGLSSEELGMARQDNDGQVVDEDDDDADFFLLSRAVAEHQQRESQKSSTYTLHICISHS